MARQPVVPREKWNLEGVAFDQDAVRACNPQRFEMEHLNAITHLDEESGEVVGWKAVHDDEFWVRGHIPGRPLLPGVIMLEALAQLTSFFIVHVTPGIGFVGFGGIDAVKFRQTVTPGQRLVLLGKSVEIRTRRAVFDTQGWVDGALAVEARITGLRV